MTTPENRSVSFIHISDTHIGSFRDFILYDQNTFNCTAQLIEFINEFEAPVDFLIHTGDVVNTPDPESYKLASELFERSKHPVLFVPGNHDNPNNTLKLTRNSGLPIAELQNHSYSLSCNGYDFLVLNCNGAPEIDPHGEFTSVQKETLREFLKSSSLNPVLFIHFPAIPIGSPWIDRDMLIYDGEKLHSILSEQKLSAVFLGHVHRRATFISDGVHYSSAPSPVCNFSLLPSDLNAHYESVTPESFDYVTVRNSSVFVREITRKRIFN